MLDFLHYHRPETRTLIEREHVRVCLYTSGLMGLFNDWERIIWTLRAGYNSGKTSILAWPGGKIQFIHHFIRVYDITRRLIIKKKLYPDIQTYMLDISQLKPGLYQLILDINGTPASKKFIKI